ncbi:SMI1/KNR4 family protein [Actinoplanes sp. NPDC051346]|uniref:SMI1/KNR4 family protein n=1 Tax=Actinoplanes sp. NPDC051346 TaxID=3155048 RepID=UPI0034129066
MEQPTALLERLQRVRNSLAALDQPGIFGARAHRGLLGPTLTESEVAGFERRHGIVLPAEYRAFVTGVGHGGPGRYGGAGPFYGLLPLDRWDEALVEDTHDRVLTTPFPVAPGREYGADWLSEVGLSDDDDREWFPGAIALAHLGCGDMAVLVVTGAGRGRVAYTSWASQAPAFSPDPDFLAWYQRWLDAAGRGDSHWF